MADHLDEQPKTDHLAERRQLHQVILRHRLQWLPRLPPGRKSAHNHKRVESFFLQ
jgi:hypothetical protein